MQVKRFAFLFFTSILFLSSCNLRNREIELENKTKQVNEKEQLLFVKEQSLEFKERVRGQLK